MKRTILIYGILLAALAGLLEFVEYQYFIYDLSTETYIGFISLFFTGIGIWVGYKLTRKSKAKSENDLSQNIPEKLKIFNITQREFEVLVLMEKGHSNQEIADLLFVSLNTIKTHTSNLFSKLDVKRRTQAVQKAKKIGLFNREANT